MPDDSSTALVFRPPWPIAAPEITVPTRVIPAATDTTTRINYMGILALFSACASGAFAAMTAATLGGLLLGYLPLWAFEHIADSWWIFLVMMYIITQIPPVALAPRMTDPEFDIDVITSWIPLAVTVVFLGIFILVKWPPVRDAWIIIVANLVTSIIDITLLMALLHIRGKIDAGGGGHEAHDHH
ncbi:MAG: hypothetical protein P4L81_03205 [Candidatus Pacebacteria bacterium]|nr:hypothetical protein [Candidatus Paceibacterota bacterium]